jgi:hypothetical protein
MSRSVRIVLVLIVALVLVAAAGGAFVWWKIAGFKEQLVRNLENAIGAEVQVSSIDLDLWHGELHAAGISLANERPEAPWDKGQISQATVRFHLSDVFAPSLPVTVEVTSWNVVLRPRGGGASAGTATFGSGGMGASDPAVVPSPAPGRIHVTQLSAEQGAVEIDLAGDKKVEVHGVAFEAADNGAGVWTTQLQANSITAGTLEAGSSSVEIRGELGKLTFSALRMQCGPGVLTGDGEAALDGKHEAQVNLKAVDLPMTMLVAVEWQMKLSGLVSGDLHYQGNDQDGGAQGQIVVNHGKFNVLPWLGKVTSLVGLQDISDVEVDKATTDFAWKDRVLHLTNLDVRKNDVTRIAGEVDIDATGQVDGKIKLGLPSVVTSKWPQLQTQVFPVQLEDYNWADVHLTGTPDHLQEDLTPRLLAAGMGQGTDLLNSATQKATDLLNNFLGK